MEKKAPPKKKLKKIKSGFFSRGLSLTKMTFSASSQTALGGIKSLFQNSEEKTESAKKILTQQFQNFAKELGELKGSLMKVGQQLSIYGEYFFPPEANQLLKNLQKDSPPLEWEEIEKILKRRLKKELLEKLDVEKEPLGSASLGQVHKATIRATGEVVALKIQYPGVAQAIDQDLKFFRSLISFGKFFSKSMTKDKLDSLFKELKNLLLQEVDYQQELRLMEDYRKCLEHDSRFVVPKTYPEFSTKKILCTSFEDGLSVDHPDVLALSQERKNKIGENFLDLFFSELLIFNLIQTDAHFGNYAIRIQNSHNNKSMLDQLILFDFGATRRYEESFIKNYRDFVWASFNKDLNLLKQAGMKLGLIYENDQDDFLQDFSQVCFLISEPFLNPQNPDKEEIARRSSFMDPNGVYHWGESDLPDRLAQQAKKIATSLKFRLPPKEMLSIDRKLGGIFVFLKKMNAQINGGQILEKRFKDALSAQH